MFLPIISNHASIKKNLLIILILFLVSISLNSFNNLFKYYSPPLNGKLTKLCKPVIIPVISAKNPPYCIILDN